MVTVVEILVAQLAPVLMIVADTTVLTLVPIPMRVQHGVKCLQD